MKVTSSGIVDGIIQDRFGKRGNQFNDVGMCTYSLPLKILETPAGTVSYALYMEDRDAIPVCGYSWIHWVACNIKKNELKENECIEADFIHGTTSWSGKIKGCDRMKSSIYGGPGPSNAPHLYEIKVFALDTMLDLQPGFYLNEMLNAMEGHVLDTALLKGIYIHSN